MAIEVGPTLTIPDAELAWRFGPSGGPGGQHANRANTRVELSWSIAESVVVADGTRRRLLDRLGPTVTVTVDEERSQLRNRSIAEQRLAERVRAALVVPRTRRATRPTRGSKERRLRNKRRASETKRMRRRPGRDE